VLDWRGIPLAQPFQFDAIGPGQTLRIAKGWREGAHPFIKLVHPEKGTTIDYAVRCLFNPVEGGQQVRRLLAFLEVAPNCPGAKDVVPPWTVTEVIARDALRTVSPEELKAQRPIVDDIIQNQLGVPFEAIERTFGPMPPWENPDYGDPGNLRLLCLMCLGPVVEQGRCPSCAAPAVEPPHPPAARQAPSPSGLSAEDARDLAGAAFKRAGVDARFEIRDPAPQQFETRPQPQPDTAAKRDLSTAPAVRPPGSGCVWKGMAIGGGALFALSVLGLATGLLLPLLTGGKTSWEEAMLLVVPSVLTGAVGFVLAVVGLVLRFRRR
jgi:hypothetical protein